MGGICGSAADVGRGANMKINSRAQVLKQLVNDGHYVIEEAAVAEAMMLRATARRMLPDVTFRSSPPRGAPGGRPDRRGALTAIPPGL